MVGKKEVKSCPNCGELIPANAVKCKHCKSILDIIPEKKEKPDDKAEAENKKDDQEEKAVFISVDESEKESESDTGEEPVPVSDYTERGFFAALFDPSMKQMITPQIVSVLFIIGLFAYTFVAVIVLTGLIAAANINIRMLVLAIIAVPIGFFLFIIIMRVSLEMIVVIFRIYDELRKRE